MLLATAFATSCIPSHDKILTEIMDINSAKNGQIHFRTSFVHASDDFGAEIVKALSKVMDKAARVQIELTPDSTAQSVLSTDILQEMHDASMRFENDAFNWALLVDARDIFSDEDNACGVLALNVLMRLMDEGKFLTSPTGPFMLSGVHIVVLLPYHFLENEVNDKREFIKDILASEYSNCTNYLEESDPSQRNQDDMLLSGFRAMNLDALLARVSVFHILRDSNREYVDSDLRVLRDTYDLALESDECEMEVVERMVAHYALGESGVSFGDSLFLYGRFAVGALVIAFGFFLIIAPDKVTSYWEGSSASSKAESSKRSKSLKSTVENTNLGTTKSVGTRKQSTKSGRAQSKKPSAIEAVDSQGEATTPSNSSASVASPSPSENSSAARNSRAKSRDASRGTSSRSRRKSRSVSRSRRAHIRGQEAGSDEPVADDAESPGATSTPTQSVRRRSGRVSGKGLGTTVVTQDDEGEELTFTSPSTVQTLLSTPSKVGKMFRNALSPTDPMSEYNDSSETATNRSRSTKDRRNVSKEE